ncbi:MAG: C1 family peptidase [Eubacteriales bacterium]|nr:C1 family peptidase [Eubacteriales bacterium]
MKNIKSISSAMLNQFEKDFNSDPNLQILSNMMSGLTLTEASFVPSAASKLRMDFSVEVPTTGITAQKQSGRCWMFAGMNMMRERVVKKCNLKDFALSGTYLAFYDKLEKGNNFFEAILHYADDPIDSRENEILLKTGLADGGQWDMVKSIVHKYGVVPSWIMPETKHSTGTAVWKEVVNEKMRENALELRKLHQEGKNTDVRREEMLSELYKILCILYGQPTKSFDFEYTDKDGVYHCERELTPHTFFEKYVGDDLDEYIGIISAPHHEYNKTYCQPFLGDVVEDDIFWLNLSMDELEEMAVAQLKSGESVYFSCDCRVYRDRDKGIWDQDSFDYGSVLGGITLGMTKKEKLLTRSSSMNHCMLFCGVNFDANGKPDRWKIENSWGDTAGQKGYFIGSEKWFREYVHQVIIKKELLKDVQKELLNQEPIPMNLWDPFA